MRTVRNIAALVFLGLLSLGGDASLSALDETSDVWCDESFSYTQVGVICTVEAQCAWDGTPLEEVPWQGCSDDWSYSSWFCDTYPGSAISTTEWNLESFCSGYANFWGNDPFGYIGSSMFSSASPYCVNIPEVFNGYCTDGEFTCNWQFDGMCPED